MKKWDKRIEEKEVKAGILGLGYVGLPLAREFAGSGIRVLGFDIDETKVRTLNTGRSIIKGVPDSELKQLVKKKLFRATTQMNELKKLTN